MRAKTLSVVTCYLNEIMVTFPIRQHITRPHCQKKLREDW